MLPFRSELEGRADLEDGGDDREGDEGDEREGGAEDRRGDSLRDGAEPAVELGAVGGGVAFEEEGERGVV